MKLKSGLFGIFWISLSSCQINHYEVPQINFYHWNTVFSINEEQQHFLKDVNTKKLYVKYFDVAFNPNTKKPEYRAVVNFKTQPDYAVVPCVFITNATFNHVKDVTTFAKEIYSKIQQINLKSTLKINEIQMDCDWNTTTQKRYFQFLESLKKQLEKEEVTLSATIRLHQIKYKNKTGVPPVEKGCLMCYNMGNIEHLNETNSIYKEVLLRNYTQTINEYPLDLNIAVPLYSWGLVYRFGKLVEIINDLTEEELKSQAHFSKKDDKSFQLKGNHYFKSSYLYDGDIIRVEKTPLEITQKGIEVLYSRMENKPKELLFYHLKSNLIQQYDSEDFKNYTDF